MKQSMGPEMRYGKALFQLLNEKNDNKTAVQAKGFLKLLAESQELRVLTESQNVSHDEKKKALVGLLKSVKSTDTLINFVSLMCDKGRANLVYGALSWCEVYEESASGVVNAYVKSAIKLSAAQRKDVEMFVKNKAQDVKTVSLKEEVDASLVAGLRVRIGSVEYDMSVRGRLDGLRTSLV